jgi:hypothetical protein
MNPKMSNEAVALLKQMQASSEVAFWMLVALAVLVGLLTLYSVFIQRPALRAAQQASKSTQDHVKGVELALKNEEFGLKERESLQKVFQDQFALTDKRRASYRTRPISRSTGWPEGEYQTNDVARASRT